MQQIQVVQTITFLFCIGVIRTVTIYQPIVRHISIPRWEKVKWLRSTFPIVQICTYIQGKPGSHLRRILQIDANGSILWILILQLIVTIGNRRIKSVLFGTFTDIQIILLWKRITLTVFFYIPIIPITLWSQIRQITLHLITRDVSRIIIQDIAYAKWRIRHIIQHCLGVALYIIPTQMRILSGPFTLQLYHSRRPSQIFICIRVVRLYCKSGRERNIQFIFLSPFGSNHHYSIRCTCSINRSSCCIL